MRIKIVVEVNIPDGATHYSSSGIGEDTIWYKAGVIAGFPYWYYWSPDRKQWMVHGDNKPHWISELHPIVTDHPVDKIIRG